MKISISNTENVQKDALEGHSLEHICFPSEEGSALMQVALYLSTEECSVSGHFRNMKYTVQHIEVSEILSTLEAGEKPGAAVGGRGSK